MSDTAETIAEIALFGLKGIPHDPDNYMIHKDTLVAALRQAIATEREECAKEMERREIEVANTIDTKAAYRNAARAIRARTP